MTLEADNQVNLLAAQNTTTQKIDSSNSSASVGIALQLGASGGGLGVTGSVSKGGGNGNGSETTYERYAEYRLRRGKFGCNSSCCPICCCTRFAA